MKSEDLSFKKNKCACNFQPFETIRPFATNSFGGKITFNEILMKIKVIYGLKF